MHIRSYEMQPYLHDAQLGSGKNISHPTPKYKYIFIIGQFRGKMVDIFLIDLGVGVDLFPSHLGIG